MTRPPPQLIEIEGHTGCFYELGQGPTAVVLISPFSQVAVYWPTIRALASHFRVVTLEMPGCGCGSKLNPSWDFHRYARWAAAFLQDRGLADVTLIGHSNGAAIAAILAAADPRRLRHLVLADSVGGDGPHYYPDVLAGAAVCAAFELRFALRLIPRGLQNLRRHPRTILRQLQLGVKADLRPIAPTIRVPTLIAWGGQDCVMPIRDAAKLRQRLPRADLYVCHRGNHDWLIEIPSEFAAAVRRFTTNHEAHDNLRPTPDTLSRPPSKRRVRPQAAAAFSHAAREFP